MREREKGERELPRKGEAERGKIMRAISQINCFTGLFYTDYHIGQCVESNFLAGP